MEPSKDYVMKCLERAHEALEDAKSMLERNRLRTSADRAYMAMHHAAQAILYSMNKKPKTHSGLIRLFSQHVVKTGIVDEKFGKALSGAFDLRQKSDYEVEADIAREKVKEITEGAELFLKVIKTVLQKNKDR